MSSENQPKKPIQSRTAAREAVLAAMYQFTVGKVKSEDALSDMLSRELYSPETQDFIKQLFLGVMEHRRELDGHIRPLLAQGWEYSRIGVIERDTLRIACYELFFLETVPPKVTINEAVNMAKKFGAIESGNFVNGVLGRLLELSPKAHWNPKTQQISPIEEEVSDHPVQEETPLEVIEEGSLEHEELKKAGPWTIKSNEQSQ